MKRFIVALFVLALCYSAPAFAQERVIIVGPDGKAADVTAGDLSVTGTFGLPPDAATATAQEQQRLILVDIEADTTSIDGKLPALDTGFGMERVPTTLPSFSDPGNSTTTPLLAGVTWEGAWIKLDGLNTVQINVTSDVASAVDGVKIQSSPDGVTVTDEETYTLNAGKNKVWRSTASAAYARVTYTNGGAPQGTFRVSTMLHPAVLHTSHRVGEAISSEDDAGLVKSVVTAETETLGWQNAQMTDTGHLKVSVQSMPTSAVNPTYAEQVSLGLISGAIPYTHNGFIPATQTAVKTTVWPFVEQTYDIEAGPAPPLYSVKCGIHPDYATANTTMYLVSESAADTLLGTGAQKTKVFYLDDTFTQHVVTVDMNGKLGVQIGTDVYRINMIYHVQTGSGGKPAGNIFVTDSLSGADNKCYHGTEIGRQASFQGYLTVPAGKRLMIGGWHTSASGIKQLWDYCRMTLAAKQAFDQSPSSTFVAIDGISLYNVATPSILAPAYAVLEGVDVRWTAQCTDVGSIVMVGLHGLLVDEPTP